MSIDFRIRALLPLIIVCFGCKKERTESTTTYPRTVIQDVEIQFSFMVDGKPLQPHELIYESELNKFGIDSLSLLIGSLEFIDNQGVPFYIDDHHLIQLHEDSTWTYTNIKVKNLSKIAYFKICLGLNSYNNEIYAELDKANMKFPRSINDTKTGGGYYACKFKGSF